MPKKTFTDADLKRIVSKYTHTVSRDAASIPNIQNLITDALKAAAPKRKIEDSDVSRVVKHLQTYSTISDKIINEAAKKVVDQSAVDDLRYMINRNIQAMGRRSNPKDVDAIIQQFKLDPHDSSLGKIKQAVKDFYSSGQRALENMSPTEIRTFIRTELSKYQENPPESLLRKVTDAYLEQADPDKPMDPDEVKGVIEAILAGTPLGPKVSKEKRNGVVTPGKKQKLKPGEWIPPKDPKNQTFFEKIRYKLRRYGIRPLTRGARNWLTDNVNRVSKAPSRKMLLKQGETLADAFVGKMFMYVYDAKWKDELPFWDKFPLIFVVEIYKDGWLGLNLHYLPLNLRVKLFDKLLQFANDKSLDKVSKLQLSYALIKNVAQFPEARPCIKRYLSKQVMSDLVKIEPVDWEIAVFLPVEQFQKQKKEAVWKDSKERIAKLKKRNKSIAEHRKNMKPKD